MKTLNGDMITLAEEGMFDVIVQGCNCQCTMGSGLARSIRARYPEAYEADLATIEMGAAKLGGYTHADVYAPKGNKFTIVNAYTQVNYGRKSRRYVSYDALSDVLAKIQQDFSGNRIAFPMIGAGLGGGDWDIISEIIDAQLFSEDCTLVLYDK